MKKYSCLLFGEGRRDKNFLIALVDLEKFQHHTALWSILYDSASGGAPKDILEKCKMSAVGKSFDLIICFIDLDKLKHDYPNSWEKNKEELEKKYQCFYILWQLDNAEQEYIKVLGNLECGKSKLNEIAKKEVGKFINSQFWDRILKPIKEKQQELEG